MMEKGEREEIEWTNTWWSEANTDNRRGLLIGDSTTRQLRGSVETLLSSIYAIDLFASSFSIHDRRFWDYMSLMFKDNEYEYDFIVLNYGGHHGFSRLCSESLEEYNAYKEKYLRLLIYLKEKCKKVICMTGTSEVLDEDINTIDMEIEREVIARNQIVTGTAYANCIEVFDLYDLMKKKRGIYEYCDRCHFDRDSDYFISYNLLQYMYSKNLISKNLVDEKHKEARKRLTDFWGNDIKCIIYGAGIGGNQLYWILKWFGMENLINYFVVSHKMDKDNILQKNIVPISELAMEERENNIFIIASDKYKEDMFKRAIELQIKRIFFYRDIISILLQQ